MRRVFFSQATLSRTPSSPERGGGTGKEKTWTRGVTPWSVAAEIMVHDSQGSFQGAPCTCTLLPNPWDGLGFSLVLIVFYVCFFHRATD